MRDWAMFSFEGNKKVEVIFKEVSGLKGSKSSYELWKDVYERLVELSQDSEYSEAVDSDVTLSLYNALTNKGIIKMTLDDYYNVIEEVSSNERKRNMEI